MDIPGSSAKSSFVLARNLSIAAPFRRLLGTVFQEEQLTALANRRYRLHVKQKTRRLSKSLALVDIFGFLTLAAATFMLAALCLIAEAFCKHDERAVSWLDSCR